ncbi:MAG: hypothetical protein ACJ768_11015 [Gaiellaceae bacterium]
MDPIRPISPSASGVRPLQGAGHRRITRENREEAERRQREQRERERREGEGEAQPPPLDDSEGGAVDVRA